MILRDEDTAVTIGSAISVRETYNRFYDAFKVTANSLYTDTTFSLLLITVTLVVRYVRCTLARIKLPSVRAIALRVRLPRSLPNVHQLRNAQS